MPVVRGPFGMQASGWQLLSDQVPMTAAALMIASREYELVVDAEKNTKQNIVFDKKEVSNKRSKIDWF